MPQPVPVPQPPPALSSIPLGRIRATSSRRPSLPAVLCTTAGLGLLCAALLGVEAVPQVVFGALLALFVCYFLRHLTFATCAARYAPEDLLVQAGAPEDELPSVTVLVPCHNEELVLGSLAGALRSLDYPAGRLEFVLVDDGSADSTGTMLDFFAAHDQRVRVLHRPAGAGGGKSAALNEALAVSGGDIVVVFDADHRPRPDCLRRLVRHFADPEVAAAQGRCVIHNGSDSVVSRVVAIDYLGGYLVNEYGRQAAFELPAYGGANCAVRRSVLEEVGGWNAASVTEDTDLTLRLVLLGHKVRYDITAVDQEEAVTTVRRYWRQRYRWARGHQQTWRDFRGAVWRSPHLSLGQKVETTMFLFGFHLPAFALFSLALSLVMLVQGQEMPVAPVAGVALWTLLFCGPLVETGVGMAIGRVPRRMVWDLLLFLPFYVLAMAVCTKALVDGLWGSSYSWVKTPRRAVDSAPGGAA